MILFKVIWYYNILHSLLTDSHWLLSKNIWLKHDKINVKYWKVDKIR